MARFGAGRKSKSGKKRALQLKGRQLSKKRPLLPKKGVTQTSYETGFFDFFKVFWKNNQHMELCNLTKQVANAWEALLPKPKLSKRKVLKDYSKEYKALQEESRRQLIAKQELQRSKRENMERKKIKNEKSEDDSGTETEANSRSNFDDTDESIGSDKRRGTDNESQSSMDEKQSRTDDESMSEKNSASYAESGSEYESDKETRVRSRREKRKRKGRKYKSYDEYVKIRNKKSKLDSDDADGNSKGSDGLEANQDKKQERQEDCDKVPKDNIFFPMREDQSFDRIVRNNYDDRNEMLRKLKQYGSNKDSDTPENDNRKTDSVDSFSSPLAGPKFPSQGRHSSGKLCTPTDTLHVKNLVVGIRQPELQDIFRVFLNDIVLIRVLDNKFNGEAVVAFKNVEAAQKAWSQMNGVEYKRLPLVLEFSNKEDLL